MIDAWVREAQFEWYGTARHHRHTIRIGTTQFALQPRFDGGWNLKIEDAVIIALLPEMPEDAAKYAGLASIRFWLQGLLEEFR